jgi:hypothetical protein
MEKDEEKYANIFEAAAKQKRPVPKRPAQKSEPPSSSSESTQTSKPSETLSPRKKALSNDEVKEMLDHMENIKKEIGDKLDELYAKSYLSPKKMKQYLDLFGGTSTAEGQKAQKELKELEARMWNAVGPQIKAAHMEKTQAKKAKARKGKVVGGHKKWIRVE